MDVGDCGGVDRGLASASRRVTPQAVRPVFSIASPPQHDRAGVDPEASGGLPGRLTIRREQHDSRARGHSLRGCPGPDPRVKQARIGRRNAQRLSVSTHGRTRVMQVIRRQGGISRRLIRGEVTSACDISRDGEVWLGACGFNDYWHGLV